MLKNGIYIVISLFISVLIFVKCTEKSAPETETPSPYLNHNLTVKYTGAHSCAACHSDIYTTFLETGKGKSYYKPSTDNLIENFDNVLVTDRFLNLQYTAYWKAGDMYIKEFRVQKNDTVHTRVEKVDYVIGSGNQTRSYVYEENGYFYEMPITWYVGKKIWDLSPGYENGNNNRFDRPIGDMCMNCHNSEQQFVPMSVNKFETVGLGMSCEKCHGPGEAHIAAMNSGNKVDISKQIDYSIVNPSKLPLKTQFDVCRQCHLEGVTVAREDKNFMDFRPGMPLSNFWEVLIPVQGNSADYGFASHAERLQMSNCFIQSAGKLTCISCHDPHKKLPDNPAVFYNERCGNCHESKDCGENHTTLSAKGNDCIGCHMPKNGTTDIPHVSTTDHFIRKKSTAADTKKSDGKLTFKNFTSEKNTPRTDVMARIVHFEQFNGSINELDDVRELVVNTDLLTRIKYHYLKKTDPGFSADTLAVSRINDPYFAYYLAQIARMQKGNPLRWLDLALQLGKDNIDVMENVALMMDDLQQTTRAKELYEKIIILRPGRALSLANLGYIYMVEGDYKKALLYTDNAIKSRPDYVVALENKTNILIQTGELSKAIVLLTELMEKNPSSEIKYREIISVLKQKGKSS